MNGPAKYEIDARPAGHDGYGDRAGIRRRRPVLLKNVC
jgi:hypothetical protein